MSDFWITITDLAAATGVDYSTIRKRIRQYQIQELPSLAGGGQSGLQKLINFYSLPEEEQSQYLRFFASSSRQQPENHIPVDILQYQDEAGQEELKKVLLRVKCCQEITALEEQGLRKRAVRPYVEKWLDRLGITRGHLKRLMERYQQGGAGAMFRPERKDKGKRRAVCEAANSLLKHIYLSERKLSQRQAYETALQESAECGPSYCEDCACSDNCSEDRRVGLKLGTYMTAVRVLNELLPAEITRFRGGLEAWRKKFMVKTRIRRDDIPVNWQWVGDHHQMDCYACDEEGRVGRPWLTAWQDRRSGSIVGTSFSFNPHSGTIAAALVHGMKAKPNSPFQGKPQTVLIDNGKDYRCEFLNGGKKAVSEETPETYRRNCQGLFGQLGIEVHFAQTYTPWSKPIERFFGTFADRFSRNQPSWLGRKPEERPTNWKQQIKELRAAGTIPTLEEIQKQVEVFFDWYHNNPQETLNGTPLEVYQSAPRYEAPIPTDKAMSFLLMRQAERKIFPTGFQVNNRWYTNETQLAAYVGETAQIRFDPAHPEATYVFINNRYICTAPLRVDLSLRSGKEAVSEHIANQRGGLKDLESQRQSYAAKAGKTRSKKVVTGENLPSSTSKTVAMTGFENIPLYDKQPSLSVPNDDPPSSACVDAFRAMVRSQGAAAMLEAQERRRLALGKAASE